VILRHLRLVGLDDARVWAHGEGALLRRFTLLLRRLASARVRAPRTVREELRALARRVEAMWGTPAVGEVEQALAAMATRCFGARAASDGHRAS
jgi:hypothetical protein